MTYMKEHSLSVLVQGYTAMYPQSLESLANLCENTVDEIMPIVSRLKDKGIISTDSDGKFIPSFQATLGPPQLTWWQRSVLFLLGPLLELRIMGRGVLEHFC